MVYQSTFHHGDKIPEKMGLKGRKDDLGSQFQRFRSMFTQSCCLCTVDVADNPEIR